MSCRPPRLLVLLCIVQFCTVPCFAAQAQDWDEFAEALNASLVAGKNALLHESDFVGDRDELVELYARHHHRAIWLQGSELTRQGRLLLQTLRGARDLGLRPDDYDATTLTYHAANFVSNRSASPSVRAEFDLGLSIAAARLVRHLRLGRINPRLVGFNLDAPRAPFDASVAVERLAGTDAFDQIIESFEPPFVHYQLIKRAMRRYRLLGIEPELTQLPPLATTSIKPGGEYIGAAALRRLLVAVGDLPIEATTSDSMLDDTLVTGLRQFQRRHGLAVDGVLGRKTHAALTIPLSERALQLSLTLERWRWLPEFHAPPIIVNIPQFKLFAFRSFQDRAADILQTDVIVGRTYPSTRTPVFTAELKYVVFRPYWEVPYSILVNEMLPQFRKAPDYFERNRLEIVSSTETNSAPIEPTPEAIRQLVAGTLRLRQKPGDNNALGLVKLMLPNRYNVYLHSTPALELFSEPKRTFSHGCIRVSDAAGLVEHVLRNEAGEWNRDRIEAAMHDESPRGTNRHVFLVTPIPVLVVYGTAVVLESGEVQFFEDIYGHDAKLVNLLR